MKKEQILNFLKSQNINIDYFKECFYQKQYIENSNLKEDEKYKIYFYDFLKDIKLIDLLLIKNFDYYENEQYGIYISIGLYSKLKENSKKYKFGCIIMFNKKNFEFLYNKEFDKINGFEIKFIKAI